MNDVTKSGGGSIAEVPKLSPELSRILAKRRVVTGYGGDEGVAAGGGDFREGAWQAPDWVDIRERDEARAALPVFETLRRPISHDRIRDFLLMLWNSTKHSGDMDWKAIAAVYPMMLDGHPGWCFRPERLKLAAHAFAWFPSVQELVAFMEPDRQAINDRVEALRKVSETTTSKPKNGPVDVDESIRRSREKQDRERREMAAAAGIVIPPTPPQAQGEDDKAYVHRLRLLMDAELDRATKEMRAGMRGARPKAADKPAPPPTADQMREAYGASGIKPKDVRETAETTQGEQHATVD